jgi:hypothetical protein
MLKCDSKSDWYNSKLMARIHGDHDHMMPQLEKKWWIGATLWSSRQMYFARVCFWWSRHLVGVITFRFSSRTMKRGKWRINSCPACASRWYFIEHMHLDRAHSLRRTCLTSKWAKTCALVIHILGLAHKWKGETSGATKSLILLKLWASDAGPRASVGLP